VAPLGLQNAGTDRRRQHHSSRGRRHCPPAAEPRSIRPGEGAALASPRATTCGGCGPRSHGPLGRARSVCCAAPALARKCGAVVVGRTDRRTDWRAGGRAARPLPGSAPVRADAVTGRRCGLPRRRGRLPRRLPFLLLPRRPSPAAGAALRVEAGGGRRAAGGRARAGAGRAGADAGRSRPQRACWSPGRGS
jgi:hypothetical protein